MPTPQDYVVLRLSAAAVRTETNTGTDAIGGGAPAAGDWIGGEITVRLPQQTADDPSLTGSLDTNAPIVTGIRPEVTIRMPLRGAGTSGTAPEFGKLMKACRFTELLTATAIGAPTAATAGNAGSATLGTPFAGTAQAYRGMPAALSGNPATSIILPVTNYTALKVAKLPYVFNPVLSTSTLVQVLPNALYAPTSDLTLLKPVTIYGYMNGLRHRIVGAVGTAQLEMVDAQPAFITFTMRGQLLAAYEAVPLPAGSAISRAQPPVWINGVSRLDGLLCNCARMTWDLGVQLVDPENPEAPQGYDSPIPVSATQRITIDPFTNSTRSPTRFGKYQQGQSVEYAAVLGQTDGNRIAVSVPSAIINAFDSSNRNSLGVDQLTLAPNVPDAGVFIAAF
ncbi:hypothetical protein [Roseomonas populi]|uniref:Phage tail protein n=1 Tax=Roseomonas populi TaxID=3121582 RepID=A0ABT1X115_9PROT|nr:hypothetical protein [Roseomonas pecuniae]MCR0981792.1 hypothetical protein [Roseomonas pecuniae]